jgi:hypothetical protein
LAALTGLAPAAAPPGNRPATGLPGVELTAPPIGPAPAAGSNDLIARDAFFATDSLTTEAADVGGVFGVTGDGLTDWGTGSGEAGA